MPERIVLVTGAGQRIGAAIASHLMNCGYYVLIHVRSSTTMAETLLAEATARLGRNCGEVLVADFTLPAEVEALGKKVKDHPKVFAFGLFGIVHNASFYSQSKFEHTEIETLRYLYALHMEAPYVLTQRLLPPLEQATGSVLAIVDTSWGKSWQHLAHYTATKAGLRQMMLNLAGDLSGRLRVNCIAPGAILAAQWEEEHFASVLEKVPLERGGDGRDIASAVQFLLEHAVLTGHVLHVDGGWSANEA